MITVISEPDCFSAWQSAASHLIRQPGCADSDLIVEIERPSHFDAAWFERYKPRAVSARGEDPRNVANTIFPLRTAANSLDRDALYQRYKRAHARGARRSWGTYFMRLIDFGNAHVNQLERAIEVLNTWKNEPGTSLVFHLSSAETDRPRPLGAPCLQLLQLQAWNGRLDISAIYRNHDYFNKALPNFVGIGRLMEFICAESGRAVGGLVCHSGHAYNSASKAELEELLRR